MEVNSIDFSAMADTHHPAKPADCQGYPALPLPRRHGNPCRATRSRARKRSFLSSEPAAIYEKYPGLILPDIAGWQLLYF